MVKFAALAGLVLGLGISAVATYQPPRQHIVVRQGVTSYALPSQDTKVTIDDSFVIEVEGTAFRAGKYAHDIPVYRIGNSIISINGNVGRAD